MKTVEKSPFKEGALARLHTKVEQQIYRGKKYDFINRYYICEATGQQFYAPGMMDAAINQVYNQYREENGIPYPGEIGLLRKKCCLSRAAMARLLGIGDNQYGNYEDGEMPTVSIGSYIRTLVTNQSALENLVRESRTLSEKQKATAQQGINQWEKEERLAPLIFKNPTGIATGYSPCHVQKLRNVLLYILTHRGPSSKTALNKLLFYADYVMYDRHGIGMTGLSYSALPYGCVPNGYKLIYGVFDEVIEEETMAGIRYRAASDCDASWLTADEIAVLDDVLARFEGKNATQISEINHQEDAWLRYKDSPLASIPYTEAFNLKAL